MCKKTGFFWGELFFHEIDFRSHIWSKPSRVRVSRNVIRKRVLGYAFCRVARVSGGVVPERLQTMPQMAALRPGPCPHVQRWLPARSDCRCICPRSSLVVAFPTLRSHNDTPSSKELSRGHALLTRRGTDLHERSRHGEQRRMGKLSHIFPRLVTIRSSPASARSFRRRRKKMGKRASVDLESSRTRATRIAREARDVREVQERSLPHGIPCGIILALGDPTGNVNVSCNGTSYVFFRE